MNNKPNVSMSRCHTFFILFFVVSTCLSCAPVANVSSYSDLQDAITCGSNVITLQSNITITSTISIASVNGMKFVGSGYYLKIFKKTAMFTISASSDVEFSDIGFLCGVKLPANVAALVVNGSSITLADVISSNSKGTLLMATDSTVTFERGYISTSSTDESGGVLFLSNSIAIISSSLFSDNYAKTCGGAIVSFDSVLNISDSLFSGNVAGDSSTASTVKLAGAGIYVSGGLISLLDTKFDANIGYGSGGAVASTNAITIAEGVEFFTNQAYNGGAIAFSGGSHTLTNCTLSSNLAYIASKQGNGGAMYTTGNVDLTAEDILCDSNTAAGAGGCIALTGNFTFACSDCVITENVASVEGGGVYAFSIVYRAYHVLTLSGSLCNISSNDASSGGGVYTSLTNSFFGDCLLSANKASSAGAGFYFSAGSRATFALVDVTHNQMSGGGDGGGGLIDASSLVVSGGGINYNSAASSGSGGGMSLLGGAALTLEGTQLKGNFGGTGSALAVTDQSSAELVGVLIENNSVSDSGTIKVTSTSTIDIDISVIRHNSGGTKGNSFD